MGPVFWLILLTADGNMHVGNFSSLKACQEAAEKTVSYEQPLPNGPFQWITGHGTFACVQASDTGTSPPR
jgi:hypothetical protein